jgi:hypothetical protein
VREHARGEDHERQVQLRIHPEDRRAGAVVAERARRGERPVHRGREALAGEHEPESDEGWEDLPAVGDREPRVQLVGCVAGVVARRQVEHGGRDVADTVVLAAAAQHLREAEDVLGGRHAADPRHLGFLRNDVVEDLDVVLGQPAGGGEAGFQRDEAMRPRARGAERGAGHAQRLEEVALQQLAHGDPLAAEAPEDLAHERVVEGGGVVHRAAGLAHRLELVDRLERKVQPAELLVGNGRRGQR